MAAIAAGVNSTQAPFRSFENQIQEFRNIVARQLDSFRAIALRHLRNHADAEDAVQDALLSAYAHLDQFKGQAQMSTWLTTIVINAARLKLRQRSRNVHISLDEQAPETHLPLWEILPMLVQTQRSYVEDPNLWRDLHISRSGSRLVCSEPFNSERSMV